MFTLDVPLQTISNMWLDWVGDCMAVTDEGSLLHTHLGLNMPKLLETGNIDLVVADHGFAVAAINAQIPVVAFFDTDDPAIPLAASIQPNIIAVPLNDNQKNNATAEAFRVVLEKYLD